MRPDIAQRRICKVRAERGLPFRSDMKVTVGFAAESAMEMRLEFDRKAKGSLPELFECCGKPRGISFRCVSAPFSSEIRPEERAFCFRQINQFMQNDAVDRKPERKQFQRIQIFRGHHTHQDNFSAPVRQHGEIPPDPGKRARAADRIVHRFRAVHRKIDLLEMRLQQFAGRSECRL